MADRHLDYAGALSMLVGMLGQEVDLSLGSADLHPALVGYIRGPLKEGGEVIGGQRAGYHPEALIVYVGDLQITLHPDRFVRAIAREDDRRRELALVMGGLRLF